MLVSNNARVSFSVSKLLQTSLELLTYLGLKYSWVSVIAALRHGLNWTSSKILLTHIFWWGEGLWVFSLNGGEPRGQTQAAYGRIEMIGSQVSRFPVCREQKNFFFFLYISSFISLLNRVINYT